MAIGDRKDGKLVKDLDAIHLITPIIYPNRCDNEAFIQETIDLTNIDKYLKKKNKKGIDYKYNFFQIIVTTMLKVLYLRPKMNYFIQNSNLYERKEKTASFVVKKVFADNGGEGLAIIHSKEDDTIDSIHEKINRIVHSERSGKVDKTSSIINSLNKIPRFIFKFIAHIVMFLDKRGLVPSPIIETDPYYCSVILTNLGSIKLHAGYHHLTNWGTTSMFVIVGEIKKRLIEDKDGKQVLKNSIDLGLTVDERIADGYYFSRTIQLIKVLLENPELLEKPLNEEVDY